MALPPLDIGALNHWVSLSVPGPPVPDPESGFTQSDIPLASPGRWAKVEPASQSAIDRLMLGTTVSVATHMITMRYHPDVTTLCNARWRDWHGKTHVAHIGTVIDLEGRNEVHVLLAAELVA